MTRRKTTAKWVESRTPWGWVIGLSAWLVLTIFSNYLDRQFDRARDAFRLPFYVIPEWRFFAPTPPVGDTVILYRYLTVDGEQSDWFRYLEYPDRRWNHGIFFLQRRHLKEIFDVSGQILKMQAFAKWQAPESADYKLLANAVRAKVSNLPDSENIEGFQFMLTLEKGQFAGGEHRLDFVSNFEPRAEVSS